MNKRQKSALDRLERQLLDGVKTKKGQKKDQPIETVPLTAKDIRRIEGEIQKLKN